MLAGGLRPVFSSEECEIDLARREFRILGSPVPVGARAFKIIEVLVQSAGELVAKDELMRRVWPGAIVNDNTLQVHISAVRKALGMHRGMLKTESGRGYRLLGPWAARDQAPVTALLPQQLQGTKETPVTNLPAVISDLIGRSASVCRLRDLVSAYRAVTLTGPGGIGKTVLAVEVANGLRGEFESIWLVELASLSDPNLVPTAVASILGLRLGGGEVSAEAVARAIGETHLLLILDNCEHLIDAAANLMETLMPLCPRITILATSREVLRVRGECVYRVAPLEVPTVDAEEEENQIQGHSAVELFIVRIKALGLDLLLQADTLRAIGGICRRLDGIPLAIEFAASRAATLGIEAVAAGLRNRFTLLTTGRRTALARHRTLRATLDWSHELLPEAEQQLFRRLAVFPGGFTLDAAAAVMTDTEFDKATVTSGIANLVEKSLVAVDTGRRARRWYLLETIRAYAAEKLGDGREAWQAAQRQAEFYLALFAPFGMEEGLQAALNELERYLTEVDNLRAALNWLFSSDDTAAFGVALAAAVADFWVAAWLMPEACEWAGKALAQIGEAADTRREMVLQYSFGVAQYHTRGMNDDARKALTRALALAREFADFDYQQRATYNLWVFSLRTSALDDALAMARQFEGVAGFGDVQSRAVLDGWLGITLIYRAQHVEAIERVRRAIDRWPIESRGRDRIRFFADLPGIAASQLGISLLSRGLLDTASRSAVDVIEEARNANHPVSLCIALAWAASYIFLPLSELEIAERYGNELVERASRLELRPYHAAGLCVRGSLAVKRADLDAGVTALRHGLAGMLEVRYHQFYPFFLVELATALGALGRVEEGLAAIDTALRFAAETGHRWFVPETLRVKGELFALRDPDDPAVEDCFNRGAEVAREQDALFWELRLAGSLARLRMAQNRASEARQILTPLYDRFTEGFDTADLLAVKRLLDE